MIVVCELREYQLHAELSVTWNDVVCDLVLVEKRFFASDSLLHETHAAFFIRHQVHCPSPIDLAEFYFGVLGLRIEAVDDGYAFS